MSDHLSQEPPDRDVRESLDRILPGPSVGFNDWLRARVVAEQTDQKRSGRHSRNGRPSVFLTALVAIAASLLVVVLPMIVFDGSTPTAWADVLKALDEIEFFSATVYEEDGDDLRRIEAYSRGRAREEWRIHVLSERQNAVVFVTPRGSGRYDAVKKIWRGRTDMLQMSLLPPDVPTVLREKGLLAAVLHFMFGGQVPVGEPVRNAAESARGELEVFDFVQDPTETWARIWVLPKSQLPVRVKLFQPRRNKLSTLLFDFADPQPETFFDIDAFDKEVGSASVNKPFKVFRIGKQSLAGKPRTADQVFKIKGVVPPKILEVVTNRSGDVLIKTDNPKNLSVRGFTLSSIYWDDAQDSWGNLYVRFAGSRHSRSFEKELFQYYAPVAPLKQGTGPRILTLRYTAWNHHVGDKNNMGYDAVLHVEKIEIPEPTIDDVPEGWASLEDQSGLRALAAAGHYPYMPVLESLRIVERLFEKEPTVLRLKKLPILEKLDDELARAYFEQHLVDLATDSPITHSGLVRWLCGYATSLQREGRSEELETLIARVKTAAESEVEKMSPHDTHWRKELKEGLISDLLSLPRVTREIEDEPRPHVLETLQTSDGYLLVTIEETYRGKASDPGRSYYDGIRKSSWRKLTTFYQNHAIGEASGKMKRLVVGRGDGPQVVLVLSTLVNPRTRWAGLVEIPVTLDVPEPAVVTLDEYLGAHEDYVTRWSRGGGKSSYDQAVAEGLFNERLERFELALENYRRAIKLYDEAESDVKMEFASEESPWSVRLFIVRCLRLHGRLGGALEELDRVEASLPPIPAGMYYRSRDFKSKAIAERMAIAQGYLDEGDREVAQRLVDQVDATRPDFRVLSSCAALFENGFGGRTEATKERYRARARFLPVDRVRYRLEREGARQGTPEVK